MATLLAAAFTFAHLALSVPAGADVKNTGALHPPVLPAFSHAIGHVALDKGAAKNLFDVSAEGLPATGGFVYSVFLENAAGSSVFIPLGTMTTNTPKPGGPQLWNLNLDGGAEPDPLLGVASLDDLADRKLEIRNNAHVTALIGYVPRLVAGAINKTPSLKGAMYMQRDENAVMVAGDARAKLIINESGSVEELSILGAEFPILGQNAYGLYIQSTPTSSIYNFVAGLTFDAKVDGKNQLLLSGLNNAPKELGVPHMSALAGRTAQIRDSTNRVILWCDIPAPAAKGSVKNLNEKAPLAPTASAGPLSAAKAAVTIKFNGKDGRSIFDVAGSGFPVNASSIVWVETGNNTNKFTRAGLLQPLPSGKGKTNFHADTSLGDPLPDGVADARDLAGRRVQIRNNSNVVQMEGALK